MLSVQDIIKLTVLLDNDGLEAIKLLLLRLRLMKFPKIFETRLPVVRYSSIQIKVRDIILHFQEFFADKYTILF